MPSKIFRQSVTPKKSQFGDILLIRQGKSVAFRTIVDLLQNVKFDNVPESSRIKAYVKIPVCFVGWVII